jgi:hypothetical protein
MKLLSPDETKLESIWIFENGEMKSNGVSERINFLISGHLRKVSDGEDGWCQLYVDPADNRYWELDYPQGHMHGGGPPRLRVVEPR